MITLNVIPNQQIDNAHNPWGDVHEESVWKTYPRTLHNADYAQTKKGSAEMNAGTPK